MLQSLKEYNMKTSIFAVWPSSVLLCVKCRGAQLVRCIICDVIQPSSPLCHAVVAYLHVGLICEACCSLVEATVQHVINKQPVKSISVPADDIIFWRHTSLLQML